MPAEAPITPSYIPSAARIAALRMNDRAGVRLMAGPGFFCARDGEAGAAAQEQRGRPAGMPVLRGKRGGVG
jgi:hypothetical protein